MGKQSKSSAWVRRVFTCSLLCMALGGAGCADKADETTAPIELSTDECITSVEAGDHTFTCDGLTYLVMVDDQCAKGNCGLIIDVHGGTMAGAQMRDNTLLHELAPSKGFIVVHPSATAENTRGFWTAEAYPKVADFMMRAIDAYAVDPDRVHFTGFSQGGMMTWHFVCNYSHILASAAPVAATPSCVDGNWAPEISLLYMQGDTDSAFDVAGARTMIDDLASTLNLTESDESGDAGYTWRTFRGDTGVDLDYIEHTYGGQAVLAGHCIPGGRDLEGAPNNFGLNATTCSTGENFLPWGETVLQWFIDHPRQPPSGS